MVKSFTGRKRIRKSFSRSPSVAQMPNLIEVQKSSYDKFLTTGLDNAFKSVFPIKDYMGKCDLEYVSFTLEDPKFDEKECIQRGMTYGSPIYLNLRMIVYDVETIDTDEETNERKISQTVRDIKEQDKIYLGEIPRMTDTGTFIINGTERVIVSQMHRSPGVIFEKDDGKTASNGKYLFSSRVIPYRGSWIDFEFDAKDMVFARIDRRRKIPVSTLLYCLDNDKTAAEREKLAQEGKRLDPLKAEGLTAEDILAICYDKIEVAFDAKSKSYKTAFDASEFRGSVLKFDIVNAKSGEVVIEAGVKVTPKKAKDLASEKFDRVVLPAELMTKFLAEDYIDEKTGMIIGNAGEALTDEILSKFAALKINKFKVLKIIDASQTSDVKKKDENALLKSCGTYIRDTLMADRCNGREDALTDVFKIIRPGEMPTIEAAEKYFRDMFFDEEHYDLSDVGRYKINSRLGFSDKDVPDTVRTLRREDIIQTVIKLTQIKDGMDVVDDIDNLGNRRIRSVGEMIENQYRIGLLRMQHGIREKMNAKDADNLMPKDLINPKPATAAIREFFASSQLSQFMDQNNALAEVTHKRRISALGPGGLTRDRAGFEVRDVHPTHYGRICPIETPEGPNIGLINSLSTYAKINKYGFIETPYRVVKDGKVTKEIVSLSAMEEEGHVIAPASTELDSKDQFKEKFVVCRKKGEFMNCPAEEVTLMDVAPQQLISVAAGLIPFLENDDANRALMGANMQRQAVPLLQSDAPLVSTGMEPAVARDSGAAVIAKHNGVIQSVDADRIVVRITEKIKADESGVDIYKLQKFQRSNQSTCISQKPLVKVGDEIVKGDVIADGSSTQLGDLALGRNVLVAYMPWNGYNYEDAILISERISRDDVFTSIHIDEFEISARDTKQGCEEITREIPNAGEANLRNLDEAGIIHVGAVVKTGDYLVGRIAPKGETKMTPEEKLLRAIFNEKASDMKDTSLKVPAGVFGTVVGVKVLNRRGVDKDERTQMIETQEVMELRKDENDEIKIFTDSFNSRVRDLLVGKTVVANSEAAKKGTVLTEDVLNGISPNLYRTIAVDDEETMHDIEKMEKLYNKQVEKVHEHYAYKIEKVTMGDDLPAGVLKTVKVYIAVKRKLQPGDKMAGRHGNKGVVSRVLPIEDMPHLADGTPVDLVLNPLGVPSRMNVGQILECHLGWACRELGKKIHVIYEDVVKGVKKVDDLREALKDVYGKNELKQIEKMSDDEVMDLVDNMKNGLPITTPVFDGAHESDIDEMLKKAGLPVSGQTTLYDGRTGEPFERPVTVGVTYMLKLHHLVDEKIHARSTGSYSMVTQQPLGGKAQFGGQRFGEMEVWALEGYGAAYTLQEVLTVKSDDITGRNKMMNAITKGMHNFETGIPESFNVLVKEMQALCLNVDLKSFSNPVVKAEVSNAETNVEAQEN
ncbi:MAG: DNA-directed RNA polymerase subunit beta [Alphaproteobacteria bacterium]|nr:DNA-directed RNA polymerase subunit beta [Alphaproteobacteria bacterium]